MNAPEKVYLKIDHPISDDYTEMIAFKDGDGVEYTRTDAFIEKAVDFFEEYLVEEDCKFGHAEWKELRSKFETIDDFIRAFKNFINNK